MKKNIFQTAKFIVLVVLALSLFSCAENDSNTDLTTNEDLRDDVFEQILNDQDLFDQLMVRIADDPDYMHEMMENQAMMNAMFDVQNLEYIRNHNENMDEYMMRNMGDMIYNDQTMMEDWEEMHRDHMGNGMMR